MAFPKLAKTQYKGIGTYKDPVKGTVFVGRFQVNKIPYKEIIGYSNDKYKTNAKMAYMKKEALIESLKNEDTQEVKKIYTLDKLFEEYQDAKSVTNKESTLKVDEYRFNKHVKPVLGKLFIDKITTNDMQKLINKIIKEGGAPQTAKNIKSLLSSRYNYAKSMRYVDNNPAELIKLPDFDNTVDYTLTTDEEKRLFLTILNFPELVYRGIFTFLLHGHRKSEVLNLKWDYIDLERRIYKIPAKINKAKKNKEHPITDILFEILVNMDDKSGYVFKSPVTGTKFEDIRRAWERLKTAAEITKPFRLHDIRHLIGYATINDLGLSSSVAAAILGHSTTKMVENRYSKVKAKTISNGLNMLFEHLK